MDFNYEKLRGRIREKVRSDTVFAKRLGLSKTSLSLRLSNRLHFSQCDIYNSMRFCRFRRRNWRVISLIRRKGRSIGFEEEIWMYLRIIF